MITNLIPFVSNQICYTKLSLPLKLKKTMIQLSLLNLCFYWDCLFSFPSYSWKILPWNFFSRPAVWDHFHLAAAPRNIQWLRLPTSEAQRWEASCSLPFSWTENKYRLFPWFVVIFHYHYFTNPSLQERNIEHFVSIPLEIIQHLSNSRWIDQCN